MKAGTLEDGRRLALEIAHTLQEGEPTAGTLEDLIDSAALLVEVLKENHEIAWQREHS